MYEQKSSKSEADLPVRSLAWLCGRVAGLPTRYSSIASTIDPLERIPFW